MKPLLPRLSAVARSPGSLRLVLLVLLTIVVALSLVLLFLLTQATGKHELYERHYGRLFALNVVVAVALFIAIGWVAVRLLRHLRERRFGSRLLLRLSLVFALAGFVPGLLIYVVSYQFVARSIESWFDVQVEGALEAGLNLGRATLDSLSNDLAAKARLAAGQLQDVSDVEAGLMLERLRDQLEVHDAVLWRAQGASLRMLASAGDSRFALHTERPATTQLERARRQQVVTWIEGLEDANALAPAPARIQALVSMPNVPSRSMSLGALDEPRYLELTQTLSESLVTNALAVSAARNEYQERSLARQGLRRMYIGTLTLSLFLAIFGAVLLAVALGNQITQPLLLLAEGVRQVAAGDLTPKAALQGRDELGGLTRSFADMTQQLADARRAVEASMGQVSAARENLQTILDNLTAGVMVLDAQGVIQSVNPGAELILRGALRTPVDPWVGRRLPEIAGLEDFARQVRLQFEHFVAERAEQGERSLDHWQQSIELGLLRSDERASEIADLMGTKDRDVLTLVVRGAELPGGVQGRSLWLLVFDDISDIVSAQRAQAWGEVARRLAHEIKNPLTPIQLSAERLEKKLTGKVEPAEQAVVTKSVKTIVDQVDAMKRLVNEFRDYARLPAAELKPLDLNALVQDVLQLYLGDAQPSPQLSLLAGPTPSPHVLMRTELDPACPLIRGDAQQLRQVLHNLLQNAQDATETAGRSGPEFAVLVRTQWNPARGRVRLSVLDWGTGFPDAILKRAFEPYVTTKAKGTGLGLAVVKKIMDDHRARIDLSNRVAEDQVIGAQVSLSFTVESPAVAT
ncbi:sensor histidine kinase [Hylemonella gracilis]|uniref:histidine kinase n=1 Tax=Hylemonella gracilis ATCC 19624 TaxID=887062 RepID=F3KUW5_9BURK|nr:multi-sensor signal transduction histidine kinase [Hylemonella gracilis ATCC 19624]